MAATGEDEQKQEPGLIAEQDDTIGYFARKLVCLCKETRKSVIGHFSGTEIICKPGMSTLELVALYHQYADPKSNISAKAGREGDSIYLEIRTPIEIIRYRLSEYDAEALFASLKKVVKEE